MKSMLRGNVLMLPNFRGRWMPNGSGRHRSGDRWPRCYSLLSRESRASSDSDWAFLVWRPCCGRLVSHPAIHHELGGAGLSNSTPARTGAAEIAPSADAKRSSEIQLELLQQRTVTRLCAQGIPDRVGTGEDQPAGA